MLDFVWYPLPVMPVTFTYRVMVPQNFSGRPRFPDKPIAAFRTLA